MNKKEMRQSILQKRMAMEKEKKQQWDRAIYQRLQELDLIRSSDRILTYISKPDEVDTYSLIEWSFSNQKPLAAPKCIGIQMKFYEINRLEDLQKGSFDVWEPIDGCREVSSFSGNTVCLVPGLAFSTQGDRLGYGKGYYDRFLENFPGITIGLCYDGFILSALPAEKHDRKMDFILSERSFIKRNEVFV